MKSSTKFALAFASLMGATSAPAMASDIYLIIDGVKGESKDSIAVESWSFGLCNNGQCSNGIAKRVSSPRDSATGMASGKRQHKPMTVMAADEASGTSDAAARTAGYDVKKATKRTTGCDGGGAGACDHLGSTGDVDGDGASDLAIIASQPEIASLTFVFHKIEASSRRMCTGKHFASVQLRSAGGDYDLTDVSVTCTLSSDAARISMNTTVPKQTQGATFGDRCAADACDAAGPVTMVITGGQMKHNKTGHVTLMK